MTPGNFAAILTIVFACLKLSGVITWSWWLVFLPVIIWLVVAVLVVLMVILFAAIKYREMGK